jgi:hypothetical protein
MERQTTNTNEVYEVNPAILSSPLGYSAKIGEDNIMVVPHLYGEGFNPFNERIQVTKEAGFVLINGERTPSGKFEGINESQLFQLVTAGVILLNEKQRNDFRKNFFSISKK